MAGMTHTFPASPTEEADMTGTATVDHGEPESGSVADLDAQASARLSDWVRERPAVVGELEEAAHAHIHLQELSGRARHSAGAAAEAQQRATGLTAKLDPAGHRILGFGVGAAVVAVLVSLDAVPLNWGAQAFGLDNAGTWLVTGILLVASVGAMAGFEMTRYHPRRRAVLAGAMAAACAALLVLRTQFLTAVAGASLAAALLQALLLTAISAGLILCGSALMARTRQLSLARARGAARRARQAAADDQAARRRAAEKMQRHLGGLRQILTTWALGSPPPAGVDHASWTATLERQIRALFPGL
jgi:hypothetical protein